jgi:hypothetical protein
MPMRRGSVYRRCRTCGMTIHDPKAKRCPSCGGDHISWAFTVDLASPGAARRQKSKSGYATKREANEAMADLQADKRAGIYVAQSKITLGDYLTQWWAGHGFRSGNTKRDYRVSIEKVKQHPISQVKLQALTSTDLREFYRYLELEGMVRTNREGKVTFRGPLARKSVQNVHICIRKALNDAIPRLLKLNPAARSYDYSATKDRPEMEVWNATEVRAFLAFTANDRVSKREQLPGVRSTWTLSRSPLLTITSLRKNLNGAVTTIRTTVWSSASRMAFLLTQT